MKLEVLQGYGLNPQRPDFLDSSSLNTFIACPSMYYMRYVLGLSRKREFPPGGKEWGTCWHEAMEAYHTHGVGAALAAIEEHYPEGLTAQTDRYKRSKKRMVEGLFAYIERFSDEDASVTTLRNEQHFQVYSERDDLEWSGRMDRLVRAKDKIRVIDYKTSSSMGPNYFDQFELSLQFPGYVWGAGQMTNEVVNEITIDVFYTISAKQEFFRRTFRYSDEQLAEWVQNVKLWRDRLFTMLDNHLYEPEAWAKNWSHCHQWYGHNCPFLDIHSIPPMGDTRLLIMQEEYVEDRWDPAAED